MEKKVCVNPLLKDSFEGKMNPDKYGPISDSVTSGIDTKSLIADIEFRYQKNKDVFEMLTENVARSLGIPKDDLINKFDRVPNSEELSLIGSRHIFRYKMAHLWLIGVTLDVANKDNYTEAFLPYFNNEIYTNLKVDICAMLQSLEMLVFDSKDPNYFELTKTYVGKFMGTVEKYLNKYLEYSYYKTNDHLYIELKRRYEDIISSQPPLAAESVKKIIDEYLPKLPTPN